MNECDGTRDPAALATRADGEPYCLWCGASVSVEWIRLPGGSTHAVLASVPRSHERLDDDG